MVAYVRVSVIAFLFDQNCLRGAYAKPAGSSNRDHHFDRDLIFLADFISAEAEIGLTSAFGARKDGFRYCFYSYASVR